MANNPYETRRVHTEREAARLVRKGWEIVSSTSSGTWLTGVRTVIVLRRPNPNYKDPDTRAEEWSRLREERAARKQERAERKAQKEEERKEQERKEQEVPPAPQATVAPPPAAPADWYADPHGQPGLLRYWDGSAWTEHTHQQER